jgi:hypothetical protein
MLALHFHAQRIRVRSDIPCWRDCPATGHTLKVVEVVSCTLTLRYGAELVRDASNDQQQSIQPDANVAATLRRYGGGLVSASMQTLSDGQAFTWLDGFEQLDRFEAVCMKARLTAGRVLDLNNFAHLLTAIFVRYRFLIRELKVTSDIDLRGFSKAPWSRRKARCGRARLHLRRVCYRGCKHSRAKRATYAL